MARKTIGQRVAAIFRRRPRIDVSGMRLNRIGKKWKVKTYK